MNVTKKNTDNIHIVSLAIQNLTQLFTGKVVLILTNAT